MTVHRLSRLRDKPARIVIGLNSGTSMDGVDALCVRLEGAGSGLRMETLAFEIQPYSEGLRERLLEAPDLSLSQAAHLNVELGVFFARCAGHIASAAQLDLAQVDLIGSHGQTLYHHGSRARTATFQAADLDIISERTGVVCVGDFRARDVAAGGCGAPLMPYLDWIVFRERPRTVSLNLGGVASVCAVHEDLTSCRAFDVGPANLPLDLLATRLTGGKETYDPGGRLAASGTVDAILLDRLLQHPFIHQPLPRTAGREEFGAAFVKELLDRNQHLAHKDILATLTHFVARTIAAAVQQDLEVAGGPREVVVSGGGCRNLTLLHQLKQLFSPVPVTSCGEYGIDPDAKEALLFAVLANERLFGSATNVPLATGARWPVCLGKLAF